MQSSPERIKGGRSCGFALHMKPRIFICGRRWAFPSSIVRLIMGISIGGWHLFMVLSLSLENARHKLGIFFFFQARSKYMIFKDLQRCCFVILNSHNIGQLAVNIMTFIKYTWWREEIEYNKHPLTERERFLWSYNHLCKGLSLCIAVCSQESARQLYRSRYVFKGVEYLPIISFYATIQI